jgi:hypothetical protein
MAQDFIDSISTVLGSVVLVGGIIWGIWKYKSKRVRKETTLINRVDTLEKNFATEIDDADKHHKILYGKLDKVSNDVAFIRGKLE